MIKASQLQEFCGRTDLTDAINACLERFEINTARRVRYFLTQAYFETKGMRVFVEDLTYKTAERLVEVWPSKFTLDTNDTRKAHAIEYINNPRKLGNFVYAGRNGNTGPDDGYNFRGRGGFDLTWKDNYEKCSQFLYNDDRLVQNPDLVAMPENAMMSAGWFWHTRDLNELADSDSFTKVTQIVNGSTDTVPARLIVLNKANLIF